MSGSLPDFEDLGLYIRIKDLAYEGLFQGRMIDFDAHGLKVNGPELRDIIENCYRNNPSVMADSVTRQYLEFANWLGSDRYVALVAVAM